MLATEFWSPNFFSVTTKSKNLFSISSTETGLFFRGNNQKKHSESLLRRADSLQLASNIRTLTIENVVSTTFDVGRDDGLGSWRNPLGVRERFIIQR